MLEPSADSVSGIDLAGFGVHRGPDLVLFALRRALNQVTHESNLALAAQDLRPATFAVMALLNRRPGLQQSQVSVIVGIRRTNLVPLLTELERRGLLRRRPVPGDRRAAALHLTHSGVAMAVECERHWARHETRLIERLGPGGKEQLLVLLDRLSGSQPRLAGDLESD